VSLQLLIIAIILLAVMCVEAPLWVALAILLVLLLIGAKRK